MFEHARRSRSAREFAFEGCKISALSGEEFIPLFACAPVTQARRGLFPRGVEAASFSRQHENLRGALDHELAQIGGAAAFEALRTGTLAALAHHHRDYPMEHGIALERLSRALALPEAVTGAVLRDLAAAGAVAQAAALWRRAEFDPARARALLKEIGIEDRNNDGLLEDAQGNVIEFELNTNVGNNVREKVAVFIQSDLKKLGVKLNFKPIDFNALVSKIDDSFDYECILLGLGGGGTDPASSLNVLKSDGFTHFWFPMQKRPATPWEARVDKLMNDQLKTLEYAERKKLYDEVQMILSNELPFIYTIQPLSFAAYRKDLGNVRPTVLSSYRVTWNAEELFLKK